jgi:hypothetical protein
LDLQGAEGMARTPSPPIMVPDPGPIQENQADALSQVLVTSFSCPSLRKSYGMSAEVEGDLGRYSLDHGVPTLEPANAAMGMGSLIRQPGSSTQLSSGQEEFYSLPG